MSKLDAAEKSIISKSQLEPTISESLREVQAERHKSAGTALERSKGSPECPAYINMGNPYNDVHGATKKGEVHDEKSTKEFNREKSETPANKALPSYLLFPKP